MPVWPSTTALGIHAPLGVLSKTLPSLSITEMCVVSRAIPRSSSASALPPSTYFVPSAIFATQ